MPARCHSIHLHQTVGAKTTIKAIAELAGVERLTVYRHFPDERSLLMACTSHYQVQNPPPDPGSWQSINDAEQRLWSALTEIYAYHRRTQQMSASAARNMEGVPTLREVLAPAFAYWERVRDGLAAVWEPQNTPYTATHTRRPRARHQLSDLAITGPRAGARGEGGR